MKSDKEFNQDLLDLCRLQQIEEGVKGNEVALVKERQNMLEAIDYKKRIIGTKIINNAPKITNKDIEKHRKLNTTEDGHYVGDFIDD